jgi:cytochrome c551/c552
MNNLPASTIHPFPPRHQVGKSWPEIADVFAGRAERERRLAWEQLAHGCEHQWHRHMLRAETLDEAAAFCRAQEGGE